MSQIKLTPATITIYSLAEIMESVSWSKKDKKAFFLKLEKSHSWDNTFACITLADFHNIVDYCELEQIELPITFDDELIRLDWYIR